MNPTLFILIIALLALSIVLIVLGRRGRRINDHPQCTWCGFDLDGVYPVGVTCPECGAGLKRAGAIRQGVRRKMPVLVWLGVLLGVLPLITLAIAMYAVLSGGGVYRQLPTGLLLRSVQFGSGVSSGPIADELMNRLTNQAEPMSAEEKQELKDLILRLQGDSAFAWSEAWGDLFESLYRSGVASKSEYMQFIKQGMQLSIQARATVEMDGELPIALIKGPLRVGSATDYQVFLRARSVWINDTQVSVFDLAAPLADMANMLVGKRRTMPSSADYPLSLSVQGSAATRRGWSQETNNLGWTIRLPKGTAAGPQSLKLELMLYSQEDYRKMAMQQAVERQSFSKAKEKAASTPPDLSLSTSFQVVPAGEAAIEAKTLSETELAGLKGLLQPQGLSVVTSIMDRAPGLLRLMTDEEYNSANFSVDLGGIKQPLAYQVLIRLNDRTESLTELTTGRRAEPFGSWYAMGTTRFLQGRINNFDPAKHKTATIIFRPMRAQALRTLDMTAFVNQELVYESIPIRHERQDLRRNMIPARPRATEPAEEDEPSSKPTDDPATAPR